MKHINGIPLENNDIDNFYRSNRSTPQARFWKINYKKPKPVVRGGKVVKYESQNTITNTLTGKTIYRSQIALQREFGKSIHQSTEDVTHIRKRKDSIGRTYYYDTKNKKTLSLKVGEKKFRKEEKKRQEILRITRHNEKRLIEGKTSDFITSRKDERLDTLNQISKKSKLGWKYRRKEQKINSDLQTKKMNKNQRQRLEAELKRVKSEKLSLTEYIKQKLLPIVGS